MKKSVITLLIFLIMIISVSAVSAADDASDLVASDDATVSVANTDTAVTADRPVENFTELESAVAGAPGVLTLSSDYERKDTETMTIAFDHDIIIDGNGSTINGSSKDIPVFYNNGKTVTLKNMILKNVIKFAIENDGTLTLDNVTFVDCGSGATSSAGTTLTVQNCIFENVDGGIATQGTVSLYNNIIDAGKPILALVTGSSLISTCTVNVTANTGAGSEWKKINYDAKAYDDNNNFIMVISTWTLGVNDGTVDVTPVTTEGYIHGSEDAARYGSQVINATSAVLANPTINTATVTVTPGKQDSIITVTPLSHDWNDTITITVTIANYTDPDTHGLGDLAPSGQVSLTIDAATTPVVLDLVNGTANYTISNPHAGNYSIRVDYAGDYVFESNYTTAQVTVDPVSPVINITVDNSTFGKQVITIALPSGTEGMVNATIVGDKQYLTNEELVDGKVTFITELAPNNDAYTVTVAYAPISLNYKYKDATNNTKFYSKKLTSDVIITVEENNTYGENISVTIKVAGGIDNATLTVKDDLFTKAFNFTDGSATVVINVTLPAKDSKYTIEVKTNENDMYSSCNNTTTFRVNKATSEIEIIPQYYIVDLFEEFNITVNVNNNGKVELFDGNTPISGGAAKDLVNGTVNFTVSLNTIGNRVITAKFTPTDDINYSSVNDTTIIFVDILVPQIIVEVGRVNIGEDAVVKVSVVGNNAKAVPTGSVVIAMNDQAIATGELDKYGNATVTIGSNYIQNLGKYDIDVYYAADKYENYTDNMTTYTFEVTKWDVPIVINVDNFTVNDNVTVNVTAGQETTSTLVYPAFTENFTVTIKDANNVISIALINGKQTQLNYTNLPVGIYTVEVSFAGDGKHYNNTTTSKVFAVKNVIENLTVVVKNVTYPNQAIAVVNATVDGKYNVSVVGIDKNYTVEVKNGIGEVTLDLLPAKTEEYTVKVVSLIDNCEVKDNSTKFEVKYGTINATLTIADVTYGENITAYVTATVDGNYTIICGSVEKIVNVTNGVGNISFAIDLAAATTPYTAKLNATKDANYTNSEIEVNQTTFKVNKANIDVNITVDDINYPNKPTVFVNASAPGTYRVFVNGKVEQRAITEAGMFNITFDILLVPGTYDVNVTADATQNYTGVREGTTFNVNKGNIIFNITVPGITYTNETNATGTIKVDPVALNATQGLGYEITVVGTDIKFNLNGGTGNDTFELPVLAPGEYTVKITPKKGDENFVYYNVDEETIYNQTTLVVKKGVIGLQITVDTPVKYPSAIEVKIESNVTCNYTVTVGDVTKEVNVTANVPTNVTFDGFDVGLYRVTVTSNNVNYTTATRLANVIVSYGAIEAEVVIENVPYGTNPVAVVNSVTGVNGTFIVNINDKDYTVEAVNGKGNVTIDVLYVGKYDAVLTAEIENYDPFRNDSAKFEVYAAPVNLTVEVSDVEYPNTAVAIVYANATGRYNITIEGSEYSYVVDINTPMGVMANVTQKIDFLPVNNYTAKVTKVDDDKNFSAEPAEAKFNVTKGTAEILINVLESYHVLDNVTITVTVPYGTGWVNITDGTRLLKSVQLVNNTANFTGEVQLLGTHVIYVELYNDQSFKNSLNQTSFEVLPFDVGFDIKYNATVYEDDVVIALNITDLKDGVDPTGNVIILGYDVTQAAKAGEMTFNLGKIAAGDYTVNITYTGDGKYAAHTELFNFTVEKYTPYVSANATGATYPNNATISFISNRTGNFTIIVWEGHDAIAQEIQVGIVEKDNETKVQIAGLPVGSYEADVIYKGDQNYSQVVNRTSFGIDYAKATIDADVIDATYPAYAYAEVISSETGEFEIDVYDKDGAFLFYVTEDVVANVISIIDLNQLGAGDYVAEVTFRSENYTAGPIYRNFTIEKGTPVILIDVTDATYPEHGIVNISCNVDGEYIITVGTFTATGNFTAEEFIAIDVGTLAADIYSVDVDYIENENYTALTRSSWLVIEQATPEIFILVDTTEILENATLLVGIPLATGDIVTINGVNVELVDFMGLGKYAEYNIGILKAGTYNFTAVYAGDKNLTAGNETITFTVNKLPSNLVVTVENTTYGTDPIMTITIDNKENVIVNLVFDDEIEQAGIIKNGSVSGHITGMAAGDHKVVVTYAGSDIYEADNQTVYYTIDKAPITVEVSADDVVFPDVITVTVKADVDGWYYVAVGTSVELVALEADVAQDVKFTKVPGTYVVSISCDESENYTAAYAETEVTLEKGPVNIVLVVPDVTYGDDIVAYIEADVRGDYKIQLGDVTQLVTLEPGVIKDVKFAGLDAGEYLVIAHFDETEYYANATEFELVTVDKAQVDLEITSEDVTYPDSVYVTIYTDIDGEYWLQINMTTPERVTLYSGIPNVFELPKLDAGTYLVSITYTGSENYDTTSDFVFVTVNKVENTTMTVEATSPVAGDNATVTVTLPEDATGIVSVKYGDGVYSAPVVDGVATVSVPTTLPGTEAAEVTYNGDTNYAPASASVDITVAPNGIIIAENIRRGVNSPYDYYATFVDKDGNPIVGVELTFTILGNTFKATTNASGVATIFAGLEVVDGKDTVYAVTVTNPYSLENTTATTTIVPRLIVVSGDLTADYLENPAYVVQAFGDDGNPVGANVTVRIVFAGFYYDMQTNATGHVERTIALAPGSYAVRGEYAGYKTNQTAFRVLQILKASSGTLKKTAKSYTLKATLKHTDGRVIAGATVKLNFNGKTYTVKTNANGVASYTLKSSQIKKLTAGKTYVLKALYVNDWTKGQWQGKIKVVKK